VVERNVGHGFAFISALVQGYVLLQMTFLFRVQSNVCVYCVYPRIQWFIIALFNDCLPAA
jgi:hypothetical protein